MTDEDVKTIEDGETPEGAHRPGEGRAMLLRRQIFVLEYLLTPENPRRAARAAGYTNRKSYQRLLKLPDVQEAIAVAMKARGTRTKVTTDRVVNEAARMAFSDMRDYAKWGNRPGEFEGVPGVSFVELKASDEIDTAAARAIEEIHQTQHGLRIKLADKGKALALLAQHTGGFAKKLELSGPDGGPVRSITTDMTPQEAAEAYAAAIRGDVP